MHPEIFGLIKSYGLMLAISFALGMALSIRRGRPYGLQPETILDLVFGVLISSIIGVRLFYVMTHFGSFHPWYKAFFIWDGGLTLYGGILLATATVWIMTRKRGIPFLVIADVFSPGVVLGIGITRIGCFMAGCCFGKPTSCGIGVQFPLGAPATEIYGMVPVYPTQLFGSFGGFLAFGLLLLIERFYHKRGSTFAFFLMLYGLSRFTIDFFRFYTADQMIAGWSNNQWISVGMILAGLLLLVWVIRRKDSSESA